MLFHRFPDSSFDFCAIYLKNFSIYGCDIMVTLTFYMDFSDYFSIGFLFCIHKSIPSLNEHFAAVCFKIPPPLTDSRKHQKVSLYD